MEAVCGEPFAAVIRGLFTAMLRSPRHVLSLISDSVFPLLGKFLRIEGNVICFPFDVEFSVKKFADSFNSYKNCKFLQPRERKSDWTRAYFFFTLFYIINGAKSRYLKKKERKNFPCLED